MVICAEQILAQHSRRKRWNWGSVPAKVAPDESPVVAVATNGLTAESRAMGGRVSQDRVRVVIWQDIVSLEDIV